MIYNGIYKTEIELKNVTITKISLENLIKLFVEQKMEYNIEVDFYDGDSLRKIKFEKLFDFRYENKEIKQLQIRAWNEAVSVWLNIHTDNNWGSALYIESNEDELFYKIKSMLQEWIRGIQNENKISYLLIDDSKRNILTYLIGLVISFILTTLIVFSFESWESFSAWKGLVFVSFVFSFLIFMIIKFCLSCFFKLVEIDICKNKFKKRRRYSYWLLAMIIIPIVVNIISNLF